MKTNSKLKLAFLSTLMIAGANAHAGAGDVAVEASTAIIQSLASKAVTEAFFPSGIDYGRMRAEMEAATRVVMTEAFVSQAEGWIKQGNGEALSIVKLSSVSPTRKYDELDRLRYSIARDVNGLSQGMFAKAGLALYATGAQAEISMLTAMRTYAIQAKDIDSQRVVEAILSERLLTHVWQVAVVKGSIDLDVANARDVQVGGCVFQMQNPNYPYGPEYYFIDHVTGQAFQFIPRAEWCQMQRDDYGRSVRAQAVSNLNKTVGWVNTMSRNWGRAYEALQKVRVR